MYFNFRSSGFFNYRCTNLHYYWSIYLHYSCLGKFWSTRFNFTHLGRSRLFWYYYFFFFLQVFRYRNSFFNHYHRLFFSLRSWSFLASFSVFWVRIRFISFIIYKSFTFEKVLFPLCFRLLNFLYFLACLLDWLSGFCIFCFSWSFIFFVYWIIFIKFDEKIKDLLTSNKGRI